MSKSAKANAAPKKTGSTYNAMPWIFVRVPDGGLIKAYINGELRIIANLHNADDIDANANGNFIVHAANDFAKDRALIEEMTFTLEACLECGSLDWAAEHDAELVIARGKKVLGLK